ncbi:hypothetical protein [Kitasatospora sp. NPDC050543]|uniref:hypothetical protein n=1 Tax=Kitasatospora sp. NPDC050543 TaxID=3364054 RepID=UPI00378E8DDB
MPADDKFEDDLLYAISRTAEGFRTEQAPLLAGGVARGRRRWRRRSAAAVAAGASALALAGAGAFYLSGGSSGQGHGGDAGTVTVAAGSGSNGLPATGGGATVAAAASGPAGAVSAEEMVAALKALLPKGEATVDFSRGSAGGADRPSGVPGVGLVFDDGHGKSYLSLAVSKHTEEELARGGHDCPDAKLTGADSCTTSTLADGSELILLQGYEYPDRRADTKAWSATLVGKDGRLVELTEWNAAEEKGAPVSRPTPPLTPAQLGAVVSDKAWDKVVAALPAPQSRPATPAGPGKEYSKEDILGAVAKLLPAGLTETETGGQDGYANFVLNDGKGKSMVEINVQDWSRDLDSFKKGDGKAQTIEQIYQGGKNRTADGTMYAISTDKDKNGADRWTVDALRPDGLRVVMAAYNGPSPVRPATRAKPVLTVEQIQAIVTDPVWKLKR